jgi:hypothetical protein
VRQWFSDWSVRHAGWVIGNLNIDFYTLSNGPHDVVVIVVNIDLALNAEADFRELRDKV